MVVVHFGESGWFGRFDTSFTEKALYSVAKTFCAQLARVKGASRRVFVAFDTRPESRARAQLFCVILNDLNVAVDISPAPVPHPIAAWFAQTHPYDIALMFSGADYRSDYGGMQFCASRFEYLPRVLTEALDGQIEDDIPEDLLSRAHAPLLAGIACDPVPLYTRSFQDFMASLPKDLQPSSSSSSVPDLSRASFVLDSMHGAVGTLAAQLLSHEGYHTLSCRTDAREDFGGIHPAPMKPWIRVPAQTLLVHKAHLAVSYDGIGMRQSFIDEKGSTIPLHMVAPIILDYLVRVCGKSGRVVTTQASSIRLSRMAHELGLECEVVPVGYEHILDEIKEGDVLLAADEYAGITIPSFSFARDALLASALFANALRASALPASELVRTMSLRLGHMDYIRKDMALDAAKMQSFSIMLPGVNPKSIAGKVPCSVSHADGLHLSFDDGSWVMLRPSRTQSTVRIYAEADSTKARNILLHAAYELAKSKL